jgi:hypothetical protein
MQTVIRRCGENPIIALFLTKSRLNPRLGNAEGSQGPQRRLLLTMIKIVLTAAFLSPRSTHRMAGCGGQAGRRPRFGAKQEVYSRIRACEVAHKQAPVRASFTRNLNEGWD